MAGKPEQPPYSAPPNQSERHHQPQGVQENSVLVYVSGDSLAYASAVGQNVVASAGAGYQHQHPHPQHHQQQQQHQQQHHHPQQQQQQGPYVTGLLPQVACGGYPTKATTLPPTATHGIDVVGTNCCRGQFLKTSDYVNSEVTTQQLDCQQERTLVWGNGSRYGAGEGAPLYNSCPQERPVVWGNVPRYGNEASVAAAGLTGLNGITQQHGFQGKMIPSAVLDDGTNSVTYPVQVSRLPEGYVANKRIAFASNPPEHVVDGCEGVYGTDNNVRIAFVRQGIYSADGDELQLQNNERSNYRVQGQESLEKQMSFGSSCTSSIGRCDSVRSDTAESTCSSLSSQESQSQLQDPNNVVTNSVYAQQAVRSASQLHPHLSVVSNNMNASAAPQRQQRQPQQQQQQQSTVSIPPGWKRICTNGVIIYIR